MPTANYARTTVSRFLTLSLATLFLALAACSSTENGSAGVLGGDSSAGGDPLTGGDATGARIGSAQTGIVSTTYPSYADASFYAAPTSCALTIPPVGGCVLSSCPTADLGASVATVSAGPITITGGAQLVQLEPLTDPTAGTTTYTYPGSDTPVFTGDQPLEVSAKGSTVPAFDETIASPGIVFVTSPPSDGITIDSRADFPLAWNAVGPGQIAVELSTTGDQAGTDSVDLLCVFDGSSSGGALPAAQLQAFKAQASTNVVMIVYPFTYRMVTPPGWSVLLDNLGQLQVFTTTLE